MQFNRVILPEGWMTHFSHHEIVFYKPKFNDGLKIEKQLVFKSRYIGNMCICLPINY